MATRNGRHRYGHVPVKEQTRLVSLVETCINVALGMAVSLTAWPFVGAYYDIPYSYSSHIGITVIFTVLSIARGYVVRRFFARGLHRIAVGLATQVMEAYHGNRFR